MNMIRFEETLTNLFSTFGRSNFPGSTALVAICATLFSAQALASGTVIFTRSTGNGEAWGAYSATFTPTQTGNYTLSFNIVSSPTQRDSTIFLDDVRVSLGQTELFRDGFESPVISAGTFFYPVTSIPGQATLPTWTFTNYGGFINGVNSQYWGPLGPTEGNQRGFVQTYLGVLSNIETTSALSLVAGQTYMVTFNQASRPGTVGDEGTLTYTVVFDRVVPPTTLPTDANQCKRDGWRAYGVFKNQGDCVSFVATGGRNPPAR